MTKAPTAGAKAEVTKGTGSFTVFIFYFLFFIFFFLPSTF